LPGSIYRFFSTRSREEMSVITAGAASTIALGWYLVRRNRVSAEEMERRRRQKLAESGRIIDGVIVDSPLYHAEELAADAPRLIAFRYSIAGVVYECSQDVSSLIDQVEDFRADLPVSIKYDPRNPANSIVVSEEWTGLRDSTHVPWNAGRANVTEQRT